MQWHKKNYFSLFISVDEQLQLIMPYIMKSIRYNTGSNLHVFTYKYDFMIIVIMLQLGPSFWPLSQADSK